MAKLMACPFCRELYSAGEREICPQCGIVLRPLEDLPPSFEVREEQAVIWEQGAPADRLLPWTYVQRGRGLLAVLCLCGISSFFLPWVEISGVHTHTLSGLDLVSSRGFWFGGAAVGWAVALPLIITRRSVNAMRGVRAVLLLLVSLGFFQALMLLLNPPRSHWIVVSYSWQWGFYVNAALSVLGGGAAWRFGGSAIDIPADLGQPKEASKESSTGQTLH